MRYKENNKNINRTQAAFQNAKVYHNNVHAKRDKRQRKANIKRAIFGFCGKKLYQKATKQNYVCKHGIGGNGRKIIAGYGKNAQQRARAYG